jgi:hypothetical protein
MECLYSIGCIFKMLPIEILNIIIEELTDYDTINLVKTCKYLNNIKKSITLKNNIL